METSQNRSFVISFRLNPLEVGKLDTIKDNRTRADWCRAVCLQELELQVPEPVKPARVKARQLPTYDKQQLSKILGQLGKIGSNVNQISKFVNQQKRYPRSDLIVQMQTDIACMTDDIQAALYGGREVGGAQDGH
jgi:hypothetical protein